MDEYNKDILPIITELFLFCGARAQHVNELIIPSLQSGKHVISERFDPSIFAYQIYGRKVLLRKNIFRELNRVAKNGIEPDVVIWLDVEPKVGLERKNRGGEGECTRFDCEELEFHERVRNGFETMMEYSLTVSASLAFMPIWHKIDTTNIMEKEVRNYVFQIISNSFQS